MVLIKIRFKGRIIKLNVKKLSSLGMARGFMFKGRSCENLLFNRKGRWAIHSLFVFFRFLALWLDNKNNVIEWKIAKPFSFCIKPKRKFAKLIEIPENKANNAIIKIFRRGKV